MSVLLSIEWLSIERLSVERLATFVCDGAIRVSKKDGKEGRTLRPLPVSELSKGGSVLCLLTCFPGMPRNGQKAVIQRPQDTLTTGTLPEADKFVSCPDSGKQDH